MLNQTVIVFCPEYGPLFASVFESGHSMLAVGALSVWELKTWKSSDIIELGRDIHTVLHETKARVVCASKDDACLGLAMWP